MKRFALLLCFVLLGVLCTACASQPNPARELRAEEFVQMEAYTGSVPADAKRKTTDDPEAMQKILSGLQALRIRRQAGDEDLLAGGIGTFFRFIREDATAVVLYSHENLFSYDGGTLYVVSGDSLDTEEVWKSLPGEEIPVAEEELP